MNDIPSIVTQAKRQRFQSAFYNFRRAKTDGIDYFNAAVVRREDGLWLVTRRSEWRAGHSFGFNDLMAFKLDEDHLPQYGIPIKPPKAADGEHFEDPRAFQFDGQWWLSACNFVVYPNDTWTGAHQVLLEIDDHWQVSRRRDPRYGGNGADVFCQRSNEKNWLWFTHEKELHSIYMTQPHTVIRWDAVRMEPIQVYTTSLWHPGWAFGHCRGGSAPILVGSEYVSFFHSSTDWRFPFRRYHMGAYTFEAKPPFRVTSVTPKPLLSGSQADPWAEGKPLVVFPCAALFENGKFTVSLGVNDLASARCVMSHKWLLKRLSKEVGLPRKTAPELSHHEKLFA